MQHAIAHQSEGNDCMADIRQSSMKSTVIYEVDIADHKTKYTYKIEEEKEKKWKT